MKTLLWYLISFWPMLFLAYMIAINCIAVLICVKDKKAAKNGSHRTPEKKLWAISIVGGAFGMYACMKLISHKTKHKNFMVGLPIVIIVQWLLILGGSHWF